MRLICTLVLFFAIPLAQGTFKPVHEADFWAETRLDLEYARRFITNKTCRSSEKWTAGCLKAIRAGLKFIKGDTSTLERKLTREAARTDFDSWLRLINRSPLTTYKAMVWGSMVNKVLQAFDSHARIIPVELFQNTLGPERKTVVELPAVSSELIAHEGSKIGVLTITVFRERVCELAEIELRRLMASNPGALILDLRSNPGGMVDEAICLARVFVGPQKVAHKVFFGVSPFPKEMDLEPRLSVDMEALGNRLQPSLYISETPIVVLIDPRTASAAEMFTAALQDFDRAWIAGEISSGKGVFQIVQLLEFKPDLVLIHSAFEVLRPSGSSIHVQGVQPNFEVLTRAHGEKREIELYPNTPSPRHPLVWQETRPLERDRLVGCVQGSPKIVRIDADSPLAFATTLAGCAIKQSKHKISAESTHLDSGPD